MNLFNYPNQGKRTYEISINKKRIVMVMVQSWLEPRLDIKFWARYKDIQTGNYLRIK